MTEVSPTASVTPNPGGRGGPELRRVHFGHGVAVLERPIPADEAGVVVH